MPTIEANGANLWYEVTGEGEAIVCIGGMALVSNQFDFVTRISPPARRSSTWTCAASVNHARSRN